MSQLYWSGTLINGGDQKFSQPTDLSIREASRISGKVLTLFYISVV
jgi:hypothetical protein